MKISREQMKSLADRRASLFEDKMVAHVRRFFAAHAGHGEDAVRETVREGIARCARYRIEAEYDIGRFIDLTYVLGLGFDERLPWAKILAEPADGRARVDELVRRAFALGEKAKDGESKRWTPSKS